MEMEDESLKDIKELAEEDYRKRVKKVRYVVTGILAASTAMFIIIGALAIINEGFTKFISALLSINLFYYLISLALVFIAYVMRFPKWELYLRKLRVKINRAKNFVIYLSMYSMDVTPGRWGRAVVSYTINRLSGVKFAKTFPAVVVDIFTDFIGFVIVCLFFAFLVDKYVIEAVVVSGILMVPFIFFYHRGFFSYIKRRFGHVRWLRKAFENGDMYFENNRLLGGSAYANSLLYTVPSMFINALSLYFIILSFGIHLPLYYIPETVFIFTISMLLGMISGIPANLGVTDAVLLGLLLAFFGGRGMTFGIASLVTIFSRITNIWFVQIFGSAALFYSFKYWK